MPTAMNGIWRKVALPLSNDAAVKRVCSLAFRPCNNDCIHYLPPDYDYSSFDTCSPEKDILTNDDSSPSTVLADVLQNLFCESVNDALKKYINGNELQASNTTEFDDIYYSHLKSEGACTDASIRNRTSDFEMLKKIWLQKPEVGIRP